MTHVCSGCYELPPYENGWRVVRHERARQQYQVRHHATYQSPQTWVWYDTLEEAELFVKRRTT